MIFRTLFIISTLIIFLFFSYCSEPNSNNHNENTPPTAAFSFIPNYGDTSTVFEFDASISSDKEDSTSSLEVRWDWDNNGTWDTEYSTSKIVHHQFTVAGIKTVYLEAKDSGGLTNTISHLVGVNSPPTASIIVTPFYGDTTTLFKFDASNSSDIEDSDSLLKVRWDWENDGTYDTELSANKIEHHKYNEEGIFTIKLQVIDSQSLSDSITRKIMVNSQAGSVTDIDGNIYMTIKIGNQWWMAENLKVTHYRNGDAIPNVTDTTQWNNLKTGAYYNYNNDESYVFTYGRLYNFYAAYDNRLIAPEGWHVPTEGEWKTLLNYLGGYMIAGGEMKITGTIENHDGLWYSPNSGATNSSGFSALPGGLRMHTGSFQSMGYNAYFWSSSWTLFSNDLARGSILYYNGTSVYFNPTIFMQIGLNIRCVKD